MNVKPTKMTTSHQNSPKFSEDPNKTPQAEGSSLKGRCSSASSAVVREVIVDEVVTKGAVVVEEDSGRERLKKHRVEMAKSRVWNIPDIWGQEELLKDWIDCSAFDDCLVPTGIMSAREALVEEGRRASSGRFRIGNSLAGNGFLEKKKPSPPIRQGSITA